MGGTSHALLERVARADHFGRTRPDSIARQFPTGEALVAGAREIDVEEHAVKDAVMGRNFIARGMIPGPAFGPILQRCREIQEEKGSTDLEAILKRVLGETAPGGGEGEREE